MKIPTVPVQTPSVSPPTPACHSPHTYETRGVWLDLPQGSHAALGLSSATLDAGLHAAAHALLAMLPLHLSCEAGDVGCECDALRKVCARIPCT